MVAKNIDWLAVEGDYRAGVLSLRDMGEKYGCDESAVRKRAKAAGWLRDPSGLKAERVRAALSAGGTQLGAQCASDQIDVEAERDIEFQRKAVDFYEVVLEKATISIRCQEEPRNFKILTECVTAAVNAYRRLRGLDLAAPGHSIESFLDMLGDETNLKQDRLGMPM